MSVIAVEPVIAAAEAAGKVIVGYFGKTTEPTEKTGANNIVTEADIAAEQAALDILAKHFPDFNIYAEESGEADKGSDYTIVIDPLDGTTNFTLGIATFAVSIGIINKDGKSVLGVIHNPVLGRTYYAKDGEGAFLNGVPIHVNDVDAINKSIITYGTGYDTPPEYGLELAKRCTDTGVKRLMSGWSPAYDFCLLASGKIEAIISNGYDYEDYAAGKAILREAGGRITDMNGNDLSDDRLNIFIASNGTALHAGLVGLVASAP